MANATAEPLDPIPNACLTVSLAAKRFCSDVVLRKAAHRVGVLTTDEQGRYVVPRTFTEKVASNYATFGYLLKRGETAESFAQGVAQ